MEAVNDFRSPQLPVTLIYGPTLHGCVRWLVSTHSTASVAMNVIREIERINEAELKQGITGGVGSWHHQYKDSAYVYAGGLPYQLTEGDLLCVFSQWGEIEDINLIRDEDTGKSKGFAFIKYEDQRSTILAVDNFNGVELVGRLIRVDHVAKYKLPKHIRDKEDEEDGHYGDDAKKESKYKPGHAYEGKELASSFDINKGVDLYANSNEEESDSESEGSQTGKKRKKDKKQKKHKKEKKAKKKLKKQLKELKQTEFAELTDEPKPPQLAPSHVPSGFAQMMEEPAATPQEDDSWRGRFSRSTAPRTGPTGMNIGGYGGRGGKLAGPRFGSGRGHTQQPPLDDKARTEKYEQRQKDFNKSFGGMSRRR